MRYKRTLGNSLLFVFSACDDGVTCPSEDAGTGATSCLGFCVFWGKRRHKMFSMSVHSPKHNHSFILMSDEVIKNNMTCDLAVLQKNKRVSEEDTNQRITCKLCKAFPQFSSGCNCANMCYFKVDKLLTRMLTCTVVNLCWIYLQLLKRSSLQLKANMKNVLSVSMYYVPTSFNLQ